MISQGTQLQATRSTVLPNTLQCDMSEYDETDDNEEKKRLLADVFEDIEQKDVEEGAEDLRWKRNNARAEILSRLPSHRALLSDHGYTLSRTLEKSRRRASRRQSEMGRSAGSWNTDTEEHPDVVAERTLSRRRNRKKSSKSFDVLSLHDTLRQGLTSEGLRRDSVRSMTSRLSVKRRYIAAADGPDGVLRRGITQSWRRNRQQVRGLLYQMELWAGTFKEIEGRFGIATVSYFRFTRWLLFLNIYIVLIMFGIVVIPYWAMPKPASFHDSGTDNPTDLFMQADNCTTEYAAHIKQLKDSESIGETAGFHSGHSELSSLGWMERTELFYGVYYNRTVPGTDENYNMSLAYLLATGACFLISFFLILKNSGKSVKEAVVNRETTRTQYCNQVFCAWDYCITDMKTAKRKETTFRRELTDSMKEQRRKLQQATRTTRQKCRLLFTRLLVHLFVMCTLAGSLYLIYFATDMQIKLEKQQYSEFVSLMIRYLPPLTITFLNFIIPIVFIKVVVFEDYGGAHELQITLIRTVLLRLASLGVLIISLYLQLLGDGDGEEDQQCGNKQWTSGNGTSTTGSVKCWETYVGQQFYKLALLDFVANVFIIFFVEFPRKFIYQRFNRFRIIRFVGELEFDLPKSVLDIVYSQTLCWLGMFFSPMIPAITLLKVFIIFYVKKLTVLVNCVPPLRPYRASRSNSFFMTVLLLSFILSVLPLGYIIASIKPSQSCGPFRLYSSPDYVIFDTISNLISTWPVIAKQIFQYLGTVGFFVPAIIILCLLIYYYWAASQGYRKMSKFLKYQLKIEGQDRQFLLARVNEVIQRDEIATTISG